MATIDAIVVSERESMERALPALRAAVTEVRSLKKHDFEAFCTIARKAACPQIVQGLLVALQPLLLPEANLIEEGSAAKAAAASHPQAPLGADARALTTQRVACLVAALEAAPEKLQQAVADDLALTLTLTITLTLTLSRRWLRT